MSHSNIVIAGNNVALAKLHQVINLLGLANESTWSDLAPFALRMRPQQNHVCAKLTTGGDDAGDWPLPLSFRRGKKILHKRR